MTSHSARVSPSSSSLLIADDDLFLEHVAPPDHPECGERLLAVRAGLARATAALGGGHTYTKLQLGDASDEQLARVHTQAHIEQLGHLAGRSGFLESDTYLSPGSVGAARRAAGAAVALVDALHEGQGRVGFALPRPPGHHALADRAMGFCLFNNVAVAAAHARARGRERVLVLDWDVHHGNGTEAIFYDDPSVLFVSLHQYPNYPGTGADVDVGSSDGVGRNVNLPLPPGGGDALYAAAFERVVLPIIEQFAPDFALVSCGFDAHVRDPLAKMQLSSSVYGSLTSSLLSGLPASCPLGLVLEGGYDLQALTESSEAVAKALFGQAPSVPLATHASSLSAVSSAVLTQIADVQASFWRLP
ncbi:MAG TPA: histone deacetylase [Polyangiaceae bacterium]|nr:histone deacetylase [Polyangiaceae bacterium]